MKRLLMVFLVIVFTLVCATAGEHTKVAASHTAKLIRNGKVIQQSETLPVPNPLPPSGSMLEKEKSAAIPNSNRITSSIRWQSSDPTAIGQEVAVNPEGQNTFIGWNLNSMRVSYHDNSSATPLWEHMSDPQVYIDFVALSSNSSVIANGSYHNLYLYDKTNGNITFNFVPEDNRVAGMTAVSRDGSLLVCAAASAVSGGMHRVYAFQPPSTTPIWTFDFSDNVSTGIYGIAISRDNSVVAVNGKFHGWILNASTGTVRTDFAIDNTESRIALSADGSVMGIGELSGFLRAFMWNAGQNRYDLLWQYKIPAGSFTNWASAVDVSADGLTMMAGSLIFLSAGYDGTIYMFDTFGEGAPKWVYPNVGDEVSEVALSDDGSIGVAGTWGDLNNTLPDILVFERESNTPVYTVNSPGSMFSVAISADGRTVAASGKAVHARQFGNGGNVYNIEVDLGGGYITGNVTLTGAPNNGGATVEVVGSTRKATTAADGSYILNNAPAGTQMVRISKLGYVASTITGVTVVTGDTTQNVDATLSQTGSPPSNLVASHSLDSRIELMWTLPTSAAQRAFDRLRAADDIATDLETKPITGKAQPAITPPPYASPMLLPDSVHVYRAIRSGGPYFLKWSLGGSASSFMDSTALPLKDYYYVVTAIYGEGESIYSNEAFGTVDSSFLQFAIAAPQGSVMPTIDGTLSPGEWSDAIQVDVSDVFGNGGGVQLPRGSVFMYFKYDSLAQRLYVAGEDHLNTNGLDASEGFGLYFDDNNNDEFEAPGTNPLLREGNYWAYYFSTGPTVRFREIYTNGGVNAVVDTVHDAQTAFSSGAGYVTGEVSIPMSFFDKNHLQVYGPTRTVGAGLFMISRDAGTAVFHGWWPQTMNSVFTARGFGDIQIPIHLLAPPKAPSNLTLMRQGQYLQLAWTDPTEGINNEPLTIPYTLELWRNNALVMEVAPGFQSYLDTNVAAQGWYEYKLRGYVDITSPSTAYFGPFSETAGGFAVSDPQLTEVNYDDGVPEVFYVVDFTYNDNKFGIRFTPQNYPTKVYRIKAFTNNGNSPIDVEVHSDSAGFPGALKAGPYPGESHQTSGVDSFLVTVPGTEPPTITSGDFWIVLSYLPSSPGAPGIGGDTSPPIDLRSMYYTAASGWTAMTNVDLIVRAFISDQSVAVEESGDIPKEFALYQNYPNPFNPSTTIAYDVPRTSHVSLKVYDVLGKEVATLIDGEKEAGAYTLKMDASKFSSGVYFYRLVAGNFTSTKKLMLLR